MSAVEPDYAFVALRLGLETPRTPRAQKRFWRAVGSLRDPRDVIPHDLAWHLDWLGEALAYETPSPVGAPPRWTFVPKQPSTKPIKRGKPSRTVVRKMVRALKVIVRENRAAQPLATLVRLLWLAGFGPLFEVSSLTKLSTKIKKLTA